MIGTTIGKYRIVGLLGRGATGIVYRAVDETLDREVAIKVLNPHLAAGDIMKRFRAEATILARLSHPEIATIHELLPTDTDLLMVMELVRGETLEQLSHRVGPMSPDIAARLVDGILSALDHAHRTGIVHRDLKPANVMVTKLGGIKIMDFGIARVRGAEHMTIDGCAVGTPAYMPPEQVLGEEIDGRADLYAVGVILHRLLTGRLPFDANAPFAMLQKQIEETPAPLQVYREGLPEWCEHVVQRALAKDPGDRFQSADEFRVAVGRATGLMPLVNLGTALAISADNVVGTAEELQGGTLPIAMRQDKVVETVAVDGAVQGLRVEVPKVASAELRSDGVAASRPRRFPRFPEGAAWLAGLAAAITLVAYLATNAFAVKPESRERAGSGAADRSSLKGDATAATESAASTSSTSRRSGGRPTAARAAVIAPVVFRTRIVRASEETAQEDAKLSLGQERLTVATYSAPDRPVFSSAYTHITAIEHAKEAGWKPPRKLSKVIRVDDDVLNAFGVRNRHHLSLYTSSDDEFIVVRVDERIIDRVLTALKERTGLEPGRGSRR